jgi:mevalonate kinase
MPPRFYARAPGKVMLSGEYAVLDGAPALVMAVDRYASATAAREALEDRDGWLTP